MEEFSFFYNFVFMYCFPYLLICCFLSYSFLHFHFIWFALCTTKKKKPKIYRLNGTSQEIILILLHYCYFSLLLPFYRLSLSCLPPQNNQQENVFSVFLISFEFICFVLTTSIFHIQYAGKHFTKAKKKIVEIDEEKTVLMAHHLCF